MTAAVDATMHYKAAKIDPIDDEPPPEPRLYEPVRCQCGDMDCEDWRVSGVADV